MPAGKRRNLQDGGFGDKLKGFEQPEPCETTMAWVWNRNHCKVVLVALLIRTLAERLLLSMCLWNMIYVYLYIYMVHHIYIYIYVYIYIIDPHKICVRTCEVYESLHKSSIITRVVLSETWSNRTSSRQNVGDTGQSEARARCCSCPKKYVQ
jgi:hypothetical protein